MKKLDLSYNDLTSLSPNQFAGLNALQVLRLFDNDLTSLSPNQFAGLNALQVLSLHKNKLSDEQKRLLKEGLSHIEGLSIIV